jgi:ADP-dependent NAD(P)H-hydrate dehydratase / NAD(P)H-hydrate epimerase
VKQLPAELYNAEAVRRLDRIAIDDFGIPGYTLMRRAGRAVFDVIRQRYPEGNNLLVLCGAGNNAGDGYVVARLAHQNGLPVRVASLVDPDRLTGDAAQACEHWLECGVVEIYDSALLAGADVVVDALLGTGLTRNVEGRWKQLIESLNASSLPVVAVDIPSGLNADTGAVSGVAVRAQITVTFIGLKQGLFTASGRACCGEVIFDALGLDDTVYQPVDSTAQLLSRSPQWRLPPRHHDSHKGRNGYALIVGGNEGTPGAVILAARAALRIGVGLVAVVCRPQHVNAVVAACPECMVHGSNNGEMPPMLLERADYIGIGCGLGQDAWAQRLLYDALHSALPLVLDADALNLLAKQGHTTLTDQCVITPHPGEAARLLGVGTAAVQHDRFSAARHLYDRYGALVVLKGSGTLIQANARPLVCYYGNPAMATAGMGDVLTGMITSIAAQFRNSAEISLERAVAAAVCCHGHAGDLASDGDDRGLMATDVIDHIRSAMR